MTTEKNKQLAKSDKAQEKPKRETVKGLKMKLEDLELKMMMLQGERSSERINTSMEQRKLTAQVGSLQKTCSELKAANARLSAAFGEFKCRELLWYASQWMRNAKFDLNINGNIVSRNGLLKQIDSFLSGWTFKIPN